MKKIWIIARMTFLEAVRRRIAMAGLALGLIFLIAFSLGFRTIYIHSNESLMISNDAYRNMVVNENFNVFLLIGLYAVSFLSAAMGALLGADTLSGDITSGIIQTIVSKPITRSAVVLGKWVGYAILLALYCLLMSGGVVFSVWIQSGYLAQNLLVGLSLIYLESLLILTIAIAYSSFLPGLATGGVVFGLYGLAFIGGWVEQIGTFMRNEAAVQVGIMISLYIPSEALWRRAAFEMQTPISAALNMSPFGTLSIPSPFMVGYALLYLVLTLAEAISIFKKSDL